MKLPASAAWIAFRSYHRRYRALLENTGKAGYHHAASSFAWSANRHAPTTKWLNSASRPLRLTDAWFEHFTHLSRQPAGLCRRRCLHV